MKVFATYNLKGGVGKTATAVNIAYLAGQSGLRTLVWDLDAQGAASFYFRIKPRLKGGSEALIGSKRYLAKAIKTTRCENVDLIPSDFSLRDLDINLLDAKRPESRLQKILKTVKDSYDIAILDCAPTISVTSENIAQMSHWLLVPLIPTHLSLRAYDQLKSHFVQNGLKEKRLLPFFSMVDKRKRLHRDMIVEFAKDHPELLRSYIPYSSQVEQMGVHRAPIGAFARGGTGQRSFVALWERIVERTNITPER